MIRSLSPFPKFESFQDYLDSTFSFYSFLEAFLGGQLSLLRENVSLLKSFLRLNLISPGIFDARHIKFSPEVPLYKAYDQESLKDFLHSLYQDTQNYQQKILGFSEALSKNQSSKIPLAFKNISDVNVNRNVGNDLIYDGTNIKSTSGYLVDTSFLGLRNSPDEYTGYSNSYLVWNPASKSVVFYDSSLGDFGDYNISYYTNWNSFLRNKDDGNVGFYEPPLEFLESVYILEPVKDGAVLNFLLDETPSGSAIFQSDQCFLNGTLLETSFPLDIALSLSFIYSSLDNSYYLISRNELFNPTA